MRSPSPAGSKLTQYPAAGPEECREAGSGYSPGPREDDLTATRRPVLLLLPPLAVLGVVAFVVLRSVEVKDRRPREESVRARWLNRPDFLQIVKDLDAYVAKFGDDRDARWFAAEAYTRAGAAGEGFDVLFGDPGIAGDPKTPVRYARLMLHLLAECPEGATGVYGKCLLARVEADEPGAREELAELGRRMTPAEVLYFYKAVHRTPTSAIPLLADVWLSREDDRSFKVAGSALMTAESDPKRVDFLYQMLSSGDWPYPKRGIWLEVIRTLGISGDPRVVPLLERLRDEVKGHEPPAEAERATTEVGLALARVPGAVEHLFAVAAEANWSWMLHTYGEGLTFRLSRGDAKALGELNHLWDRDPGRDAQFWIAYGCLLGDPPLPGGVPAEKWADAILGHGLAEARSVAHAYRFRVRKPGDPAPLRDLLEDLRAAVRDPQATSRYEIAEGGPAFVLIEALRAIYRWGDR